MNKCSSTGLRDSIVAMVLIGFVVWIFAHKKRVENSMLPPPTTSFDQQYVMDQPIPKPRPVERNVEPQETGLRSLYRISSLRKYGNGDLGVGTVMYKMEDRQFPGPLFKAWKKMVSDETMSGDRFEKSRYFLSSAKFNTAELVTILGRELDFLLTVGGVTVSDNEIRFSWESQVHLANLASQLPKPKFAETYKNLQNCFTQSLPAQSMEFSLSDLFELLEEKNKLTVKVFDDLDTNDKTISSDRLEYAETCYQRSISYLASSAKDPDLRSEKNFGLLIRQGIVQCRIALDRREDLAKWDRLAVAQFGGPLGSSELSIASENGGELRSTGRSDYVRNDSFLCSEYHWRSLVEILDLSNGRRKGRVAARLRLETGLAKCYLSDMDRVTLLYGSV